VLRAVAMLTIAMTAATPIMMPSAVRMERMVLRRRARKATLMVLKTRMARRLSDFCPASLLLAKPPNPTRGNGQNLGDLYANWSQIGSSDYIPCS